MKIGFLTPEFPNNTSTPSGGIGASILNLSNGLIKQGHKVVVLIYGQDKDEEIIDGSLSIYKIKNVKVKGLSFYFTQKKIQRLIHTLHTSGKIDIVEAPDWTGFSAFVNIKCPLVIKLHGSDAYFCHLDKRKVKFKNKYFERRALNKADGVIAVSDFVGKLTNEVFKLKKHYEVIPNAIDTKLFEPEESKQTIKQILYFGTLIRKKGVLEIPEIFNRVVQEVPDVQLVLVGKDAFDIITGSNSTWNIMKSCFSKDALSKVEYVGQVPYSKIKSYINDSSLCIFPSFAEAFPVSWLEAMAMKKPIVASNIGWAKEMIEDGKEGYLVNPKEHEVFAERILRILKEDNYQVELGDLARKKVEDEFSIESIARRTIEFYNKFVS